MKKFFIMILLFSTNTFGASIGDVILQEGNSVVERKEGDEFESKKDLDIFSYDTVRTGKGKTAIEFVDDTRVDVTEHSKLVIDEFVYDPNTKTGALSLKASLGTVRYASGQIAKNSKQNVKITTPTATIGVRGTDFTMTIDETGSSTIILLPSCDTNGNCYVGEIDVTSDAGQVIMNQAFQATVVETVASNPMKPVILDLDEKLIGNLLIISKPKEIQELPIYKVAKNWADLDRLQNEEKAKSRKEGRKPNYSLIKRPGFVPPKPINLRVDYAKSIPNVIRNPDYDEFFAGRNRVDTKEEYEKNNPIPEKTPNIKGIKINVFNVKTNTLIKTFNSYVDINNELNKRCRFTATTVSTDLGFL